MSNAGAGGRPARDDDADGDPNPGPDAGPLERTTALLERARTEPRAHAVAVVLSVAIGLLLASLHWFGLVVGGAIVGAVTPSLRRAVVGAVGFGVVVLIAFALVLGTATWTVLETTPVVYLTVGAAIGLPVLGSLSRGLY